MKRKIILLLLITTFSTAANFDDSALKDITSLSNQSEIPYEKGIQALLTLPDIFFARDFDHMENQEEKKEELRKWKTRYNKIQNKLFVLTHIARIRHQLSRMASNGHVMVTRHRWQTQERMARVKIKRDQLQALKRALQIISDENFDHGKYQFYSLSDLGRIDAFSPEFSKSFSKTFSKSFSKIVSKGGYGPGGTFSLQLPAIDDFPFSLYSRTRSGENTLREPGNDFRQFVLRYRSQAFDMFEDTTLPEEALQFLSRLGIEGLTPYFVQKDLSHLYGTASPSQARSNACVGFALAADIEVELQRTGQIRRNEALSPYSVYATLRYREDGIPSPDCLALYGLSNTIAEGRWEMDIGIRVDFFENLANTNFCLTSPSGNTINHAGYTSIKSVEGYAGKITFALLKTMIDHRKPPMLFINSDAREEIEDWINITENGKFSHALVVVGYGTEDIDPFTLKKGPYFLIRDSLASRPIHYKVSAKNLLDNSFGILKIGRLKRH